MNYIVRGLDPAPFQHLYGQPAGVLQTQRARRVIAGDQPAYPDRVTLGLGRAGQALLLVNHTHLDVATPYRASHAIYVLEGAQEARVLHGTLPASMRASVLSLRAFDDEGMMLDADLAEGGEADAVIERLLALPGTAYLHAHYARRGCDAARIERG
jgi:Protein of unknown function (DUF1203)